MQHEADITRDQAEITKAEIPKGRDHYESIRQFLNDVIRFYPLPADWLEPFWESSFARKMAFNIMDSIDIVELTVKDVAIRAAALLITKSVVVNICRAALAFGIAEIVFG